MTRLLDCLGARQSRVIRAKDHRGCTPFHIAAASGARDILKLFYSRVQESGEPNGHRLCGDSREIEVVVSAQDEDGWTALHHAAANNRGLACRFLLDKAQADLGVLDNDGRAAVQIARWNRHVDLARSISVFGRTSTVEAAGETEESPTVADGSRDSERHVQQLKLGP